MQSITQNEFGNEAENEQVAEGEKNPLDGRDSSSESKIDGCPSGRNKGTPKKRGEKCKSIQGVSGSSNNTEQNKNGNILRSVSEKVISQHHEDRYSIYNGDSVEVIRGIPDNSIHFQVMSPPFCDLFVYSNSERDLGNCKSDAEFFENYKFLIAEQFRVAMMGRLCAIHVMQLPTSKTRHGVIGLRDFRGECIRAFVDAGWIYHSEVCIWKDPVTAMQRTKALGLLHKQIKKDSSMSRNGVADYLVVFRKPRDNPERIAHTAEEFPVSVWQRYASPVWASVDKLGNDGFLELGDTERPDDNESGIDQGNTLQGRSVREHKDEKHLCCLQKGVIRRAINLWSNPNDIVASWFMGIGSEGYVSLEEGRRFIGNELKPVYFRQACANLQIAQSKSQELSLF